MRNASARRPNLSPNRRRAGGAYVWGRKRKGPEACSGEAAPDSVAKTSRSV
jgi:hypothetical protein